MTAVTTLLVRKSSKQGWSTAGEVHLTDSRESLEEKLDALNEGSGFAKYRLGETIEQVKELRETEQSTAFDDDLQARVDKALDQVGGAPVELEAN
jgi:hypothetical protein